MLLVRLDSFTRLVAQNGDSIVEGVFLNKILLLAIRIFVTIRRASGTHSYMFGRCRLCLLNCLRLALAVVIGSMFVFN